MSTEITPVMRRSVLIATLRDKTLWPEGFEWNYVRRCQCAIGLSAKLFGREFDISWGKPCPEFGLSGDQVDDLFNGWGMRQDMVTPTMVANRLEKMHRANS